MRPRPDGRVGFTTWASGRFSLTSPWKRLPFSSVESREPFCTAHPREQQLHAPLPSTRCRGLRAGRRPSQAYRFGVCKVARLSQGQQCLLAWTWRAGGRCAHRTDVAPPSIPGGAGTAHALSTKHPSMQLAPSPGQGSFPGTRLSEEGLPSRRDLGTPCKTRAQASPRTPPKAPKAPPSSRWPR